MKQQLPLNKLQNYFQDYILGDDEQMERHVAAPDINFARERLDIYAEAYVLRLIEVLEVDYPALKKYLGEDSFTEIAEEYIETYPSAYAVVRYFGQHMAEFLQENYADQPELAEIAAFEWALADTLDAKDASVLTMQDLANVPQDSWADMCISLHPSVQLVEFQYNVYDIWKAANEDSPYPDRVKSNEKVTWRFWRRNLDACFAKNTVEEAWMLKSLLANKTFGELCEGLCEWLPEDRAAEYAVNALVRWLNEGLLSTVYLK